MQQATYTAAEFVKGRGVRPAERRRASLGHRAAALAAKSTTPCERDRMQTNPTTMRRKLRKLSAALKAHEMYFINCGGCGVMAGIVGEILELWGIQVEVVTPSDYGLGVPPKEARERLQAEYYGENWTVHDWYNNGLYLSHLAVRFVLCGKLHTWDSNGLLCSDKFFGRSKCGNPLHVADYPFGEGMTVQECIEISSTPSGWNRTFDRNQIPLMRELAYQYLLP